MAGASGGLPPSPPLAEVFLFGGEKTYKGPGINPRPGLNLSGLLGCLRPISGAISSLGRPLLLEFPLCFFIFSSDKNQQTLILYFKYFKLLNDFKALDLKII
jgi:hypothetical protein